MEVNQVSAEFALRESLRKENSPLKKLGKVHHTVKRKKILYALTNAYLIFEWKA